MASTKTSHTNRPLALLSGVAMLLAIGSIVVGAIVAWRSRDVVRAMPDVQPTSPADTMPPPATVSATLRPDVPPQPSNAEQAGAFGRIIPISGSPAKSPSVSIKNVRNAPDPEAVAAARSETVQTSLSEIIPLPALDEVPVVTISEVEPPSAVTPTLVTAIESSAVVAPQVIPQPPPLPTDPSPRSVPSNSVSPPTILHEQPLVTAQVPLVVSAAPLQIGNFTQYGTITTAEVRALALQNNKDIAVLGHVPQVNANLIDSELSVFDPVFNVALNGGHYNQQTSSQIQALGSNIPTLRTSFWQPVRGLNQVFVEKQFVTGGKVQAGLGQTYYNYTPAGSFVFVNPAYTASFNLLMEQPLFRGRGPAATTAPTQIARANHEQSWHSFQATVNQVLRDAEMAYWDMYAAYQDFEVRDVSYRQALETLNRERGRLQLGEGSVPDVAQAEEQAEAFHIARTDAETRLTNAQRTLRRLLGLPPGDPRPLIPATPASDAPLELDWDNAAQRAQQRPEFAAQQAVVRAVQIDLARRRNGLLPDLAVTGIYSVSGLDTHFDEAWSTVGTFSHNSWTAGVLYRQPFGRRNDRALADRATAALALETAKLQQLEHEILHQLHNAYQNVLAAQKMLDLHRRRREAAGVQLTARRELYVENKAALRDQLDAEERFASALYGESLARVNYQRMLTEWNYARGAMNEGDFLLAP